MSSSSGSSPNNPTKYLGPNVYLNTVVARNREPTGADFRQPETGRLYPINTFWNVTKNPTTGVEGDTWYLTKIVANVAYWIQMGADFTLATVGTTVQFTNTGNDWLLDFSKANMVIGSSLEFDINSDNNTGFGHFSLRQLTTGNYNVAVGLNAGNRMTTGNNNTYAGSFSGERTTSGFSNCAFGNLALQELTTGSRHVAIGDSAGLQLLGGSRNVMIGYLSGASYTGTESHNICLGSPGVIGDNNLIRIGNEGGGAGQQNECYIAGVATTVNANATQLLMTVDSVTGRIGHTNGYVKTIFTDGFATGFHATGSNYQVLVDDCIIAVTDTVLVKTMTMPNTGMRGGQQWIIKDESGAAAGPGVPIIINGNGALIDGAATTTINTNYGSKSLYWNGSAFFTF